MRIPKPVLVGLAIKNGILLVDRTNHNRERGMAQVEHAEATGVAWNDQAVEKFAI